MKREFHFNTVLTIALLAFYPYLGKTQEVSYRHFGVKEGLPSSEVYSIIQDSKGYIWLSTDGGVCRYNGRKFTCFTTDDGLKDNTVFNLFEDRKGRIWMICYNGAVCYYENGKISAIPASDSLMKILKNGLRYIHSSALDTGDTLWLGTIDMLLKIAPANNYKHVIVDLSFNDSAAIAIKVFKNKKTVISSNYNSTLDVIKKSQINNLFFSYYIQSKGECQFTKRIYYDIKLTSSPIPRCIYLKDGRLLVTELNNIYIYVPGKPLQKQTYENRVIFLNQDSYNNLWIGFSKGGAYKYSSSDFKSLPTKYFSEKSVSSILTDTEGGIWFTTHETGVYYVPMSNYIDYKNNSFFDEKICGLDVLGNKTFVYNNKNQVRILNSNNTIDSISVKNLNAAARSCKFYFYNNKFFIIGSILGEIDTLKNKIKYFTNILGTQASGIALAPLNSNDLYLALSGNYIYKIKKGVALTGALTNNQENEEITPSRAACMIKTIDGSIHLGTKTGLYQYSDEKFIPEFTSDTLFRSSITCMEQDSKGRLLLGTKGKGLIITKNGKHIVVGTSQGLVSDICSAILPDTNETIWVGTNKGISLLKINSNDSVSMIANINTSHGLSSNEITRLARRGNTLYVGTKEGLCEIDVSQPFYNTTPPPVFISSVYANKILITNENAKLEYNQNNFRFYIDCLSYKDNSNPSYYYRLRGYDSTLQLSTTEFIDYTNLPPGNYKLEVIGKNNNNILSTAIGIYSFSITKPFWRKWWFILAEIMTGAGIVFCFIRIRLKNIRKKEEEKTKINTLIAESQMTALRSQMNPHFIFNSINSIQNYILKQNTQQAYDYLTKFSKLIRMVLNNSKENMLIIEQELATLSIYVELEQMRFDKSFDFLINFDNKVDLGNCLIPGMLIQPFIENAIWHGIMPLEGLRRGLVSLNIRIDSQCLIISIEDNGVGREKSKLINKSANHRSIGMMLSQNRMTILNQSKKEEKYSMIVEDLYNEKKQPAGTKIILTIPILLQNEN